MIWRRKSTSTTTDSEKPKGFDDFDVKLGDLMRGERATLGKSLLDVQRDLRIKATYIAAIENCDTSAFETPGFVAGYVRSYARYLDMDPDEAFRRFCREAKFEVAHGMSAAATPATIVQSRARSAAPVADPLGNPNALFVPRREHWLHRIEPGAVGSLAVLIAVVGALGYGGWSLLQEVQRVQLAPVDRAPVVLAEIDPLARASAVAASDPAAQAMANAAPNGDLMNRLYRPQAQALDVPVMEQRDGPIATINPRIQPAAVEQALAAAMPATPADPAVQVSAAAAPGVELFAVRPSWVRVSTADGTVLFEKILDAGERYSVPQMEQAAVLRSGESGAIYFSVNGQTYGPAGARGEVRKNIALSPESLTQTYALADTGVDADLARVVADASAVTEASQN